MYTHAHAYTHICTPFIPIHASMYRFARWGNHMLRYVAQQNRIPSDYPAVWPKENLSVNKAEMYDLTPDSDGK